MKLKNFARFDFVLLFTVIILSTIGILFIYSSGINSNGVLVSNEHLKQIFFVVSGLIILVGMSLLDYRKLMQWSGYIFIGLVLLLLYTKFFGRYVNGSRRWLGIGDFGIQPSQFGIIAFIIFLSWYLQSSEKTPQLRRFVIASAILCVPFFLILIQPDLGTALIYIPIFLVLCFVADIPLRYIFAVFLTGCLVLLFTVLPIWERVIYQKNLPILRILTNLQLRFIIISSLALITLVGLAGLRLFKNGYFYWISYFFGIVTLSLVFSLATDKVLKDYQIMRLIVFLDPYVDRLGAGWNIIQSKIAIGSGNVWGQGYLSGTQSHYRFLPEQSTDFIFSILSEEWGFMGGVTVFVLYFIVLLRGIFIIRGTSNNFSFYTAVGIVFMFFFHFMINIGMVMGIMPITGLPLMMVSYGGSSLWTSMVGIGILISIHIRRMDFSGN